MARVSWSWFTVVVLAVAGCGHGSAGVGTDYGGKADVGMELAEEAYVDRGITTGGHVSKDGGDEWGSVSAEDVVEDVSTDMEEAAPLECAPPGGVGCPCEQDSDCAGGLCVWTDEGLRCTRKCALQDDSCVSSGADWCDVDGWALQKVSSPLFGKAWVCLPLHPKLCRPCMSDTDCSSWVGAACMDYGPAGRFCATRCNDVVFCPAGYDCVKAEGHPGLERVCLLAEGECACSTMSKLGGASTVCYVKTEAGACIGKRECKQEGLGACSAAAPAQEVCDQVDNDCDASVDEEGAEGCTFLFQDADQDGFGSGPGKCLCSPLGEYVAGNNADCDDSDPSVHPGVLDPCDSKDNDCDGLTDEDGGGGQETCNGVDDDCDGEIDEEGALGCTLFYEDADADGFGVKGKSKCLCSPAPPYTAAEAGDCGDNDANVHPGAKEVCNGVDDDCDGQTDPVGTCAQTPTRKVCLDAGHGGSDPGAKGYVVEKDVNLDIVLRLRDLLVADTNNPAGGGAWKALLTRDKDVSVSLEARVNYANSNAVDRFMSTHSNACGYCGGHGTETYWYTYGSTKSHDLANKVQTQVVAHLGTKDRGVKQANFYVLKYTTMPAILLESAFVDNEDDAAKLGDPAMRQEIARGQMHGLQKHYGYTEFDP